MPNPCPCRALRFQTVNLVRLFDRKSCVSVHGPAALVLAQQLYGSTSKARPAGGDVEGLPSVTLSWALLPSALRFLLVDPGEHSVELYEGSGTNWTVAKYVPGTGCVWS